jgi:hypothetical protein
MARIASDEVRRYLIDMRSKSRADRNGFDAMRGNGDLIFPRLPAFRSYSL